MSNKERKDIKTEKLPFGEHLPEDLSPEEREKFLEEKLGIKSTVVKGKEKKETKDKKDN